MAFSSVYSGRPHASDQQVLLDHNIFTDPDQAMIMDVLKERPEWLFIYDTEHAQDRTPVTGLCLNYGLPTLAQAFVPAHRRTGSLRPQAGQAPKPQWLASHLFVRAPSGLVDKMTLTGEQAYLQRMYAHLYARLVNFACGYHQNTVQMICRADDLMQAINIGHLPVSHIKVMPDVEGEDIPLAVAQIKTRMSDLTRYQQITAEPITLIEELH